MSSLITLPSFLLNLPVSTSSTCQLLFSLAVLILPNWLCLFFLILLVYLPYLNVFPNRPIFHVYEPASIAYSACSSCLLFLSLFFLSSSCLYLQILSFQCLSLALTRPVFHAYTACIFQHICLSSSSLNFFSTLPVSAQSLLIPTLSVDSLISHYYT